MHDAKKKQKTNRLRWQIVKGIEDLCLTLNAGTRISIKAFQEEEGNEELLPGVVDVYAVMGNSVSVSS